MNGRWHPPREPVLADDDPRLVPTIDRPGREADRQAEVDRIVGPAEPVEGRRPVLYLMGGGAGSGKSSVKDLLREHGRMPKDNIVDIDPDDIKERIPEFSEVRDLGDHRASDVVHGESKHIAERARETAMEQKKDVCYDTTLGAKDPAGSLKMIDQARQSGYDVHLYGVTVSPETAMERSNTRAAGTEEQPGNGRYVPDNVVLEGHKNFSANFPAYADRCDRATLYDNSGDTPAVVADKEPGRDLLVTDQGRYADFQKKAELDPAASGPGDLYRVPEQRTGEQQTRSSERSGPPRPPAEDMQRVTPEQSSGGDRDAGGGGRSEPPTDRGGADPT